jgi:hypothetical protein
LGEARLSQQGRAFTQRRGPRLRVRRGLHKRTPALVRGPSSARRPGRAAPAAQPDLAGPRTEGNIRSCIDSGYRSRSIGGLHIVRHSVRKIGATQRGALVRVVHPQVRLMRGLHIRGCCCVSQRKAPDGAPPRRRARLRARSRCCGSVANRVGESVRVVGAKRTDEPR